MHTRHWRVCRLFTLSVFAPCVSTFLWVQAPPHTDGGNKDVCIFDRRQNAVRWKRRRGIPYDAQHHEKGCCELRDVYKLV